MPRWQSQVFHFHILAWCRGRRHSRVNSFKSHLPIVDSILSPVGSPMPASRSVSPQAENVANALMNCISFSATVGSSNYPSLFLIRFLGFKFDSVGMLAEYCDPKPPILADAAYVSLYDPASLETRDQKARYVDYCARQIELILHQIQLCAKHHDDCC
jgi:hypothetical protein